MVVFLLALIAAILLFGASGVRSALASILFFAAVLVAVIALWLGAASLSTRDWITLGLTLVGAVALLCGWSVHESVKAERRMKNAGHWQAQRVSDQDNSLGVVGLDSHTGRNAWPPSDSAVRRVWGWYETAIEQQFSFEDQRLARGFYEANDALRLDCHCRKILAAKESSDRPAG